MAGKGEKTNACRDLVGKPEGRRPLGKCSPKYEVKVRLYRYMPGRHRGEIEVLAYTYPTLVLESGGWSGPRPGHFTPGRQTQCSLYRRLVSIYPENLALTGVQAPDRPTRSQ